MGLVGDRDIERSRRLALRKLSFRCVSVSPTPTPTRDYQDGTQSAKRNTDPFPTMHSHTEQKFELPIAMTATEAKRIADKSLKMAWTSRLTYKMKLAVGVPEIRSHGRGYGRDRKGNSYEMRLSKMGPRRRFHDRHRRRRRSGSGLRLDGRWRSGQRRSDPDDQPWRTARPVPAQHAAAARYRRHPRDRSVYYAAAKAKSPGTFIWRLFVRGDRSARDRICGQGQLLGRAGLGHRPERSSGSSQLRPRHDDRPTVRVMSLDASFNPVALSSCTFDDLLTGKNAAIVGNEVIQFMTATPAGGWTHLQPDRTAAGTPGNQLCGSRSQPRRALRPPRYDQLRQGEQRSDRVGRNPHVQGRRIRRV
jgi:hypothetical protein